MGEGEVPVPCGVDPVLGTCSSDTELSHGGRRGQVQELKEGGATVAEWGLRLGDLIVEARWLEMP